MWQAELASKHDVQIFAKSFCGRPDDETLWYGEEAEAAAAQEAEEEEASPAEAEASPPAAAVPIEAWKLKLVEGIRKSK
jgi:hypothetical protein